MIAFVNKALKFSSKCVFKNTDSIFSQNFSLSGFLDLGCDPNIFLYPVGAD